MIKLTKLDNGLTVASGYFPSFRSVAAGFWVGAGSAFESGCRERHIPFYRARYVQGNEVADGGADCGTLRGSRRELQCSFTSKEATCYYFKCIDENAEKCFALLSHILFESVYDDAELDKERKVIAEEINMVEDEPEDICYDLLSSLRYRGTDVSKTILGPKENVMRFTGRDVRDYVKRMYTPDNIVVSLIGNIRHEDAVALVEKYVLPLCGGGKCAKTFPAAVAGGGYAACKKDFEQVNLAIGFPSVPYDDADIAVQNVVSFCFGTGMSSRLFQRLRERQGLVYNVYTSLLRIQDKRHFRDIRQYERGQSGKSACVRRRRTRRTR